MGKNDLGIALIGAGRAGMIHAENFAHRVEGARIVAVVDVVEENAKKSAALLDCEKFYTDYTNILNDPSVQAVMVVSPTNLHKQIVIDCANAGKHIFCEKPMAMNTTECDEMIEACRKNRVKLQIGFMRRHDENFCRAKELVESGTIGELVLIRSNTRGPSKPRPWMYDIKKSNGILAEINSHDIDSIRWFAGSEIKRLFAVAGNYRNPEVAAEYPDYYDNVVMNGVFENGIQFSIDGAAYVEYGYDSKMELVGTKGVLHIGRNEGAFLRYATAETGICEPFIQSWMTLFKDAYLAEDNSFASCVRRDMQPKVTGADGRMAVRIVEAGNESISSGGIVEL
ncbi:MAG: Gfo/Idh/MocA family oxidoreductase [Eubacteriales bacterium]|nr:Gfo/Idh/MocA family oxidoreductase [Eubacteriales bacterium]